MSHQKLSKQSAIFNKSCYGLAELDNESIHAVVTDPPYGISFQNHKWDKHLPRSEIWDDCFRVLKPGGFALVFSSVRQMHRLVLALEDSGFLIRDVLMWAYLNGMPKTRDIGLDIDRELGIPSLADGHYRYVQGYQKNGAKTYTRSHSRERFRPASDLGLKFKGAGTGLKPAYEPIILVQKPIAEGMSIAQNVIKYGTGALNLEASRIPYGSDDEHVGHNPHPKGRVAANVLRTTEFGDGYDKFFLVPKVRQRKEDFNSHPTIKPVSLMVQLINLVSFPEQIVLDPFAGSGSTAVACVLLNRHFLAYEIDPHYFRIAIRRIEEAHNAALPIPPDLHVQPRQSQLRFSIG